MQTVVKKSLADARGLYVLITGASGELGRALALHYAAEGADLCLWGRDSARLADVAAACITAGKTLETRAEWHSLDLADIPGAVDAALMQDARRPFDLAIFASGLGDIRAVGDRVEDAALVARLATVNFSAPAAMAAALAGRMAERGHGGVVLIGSAAAFHALPFAAAYSGSKAGLARFADALRLSARPHGVAVTLVSPGFIDTAAGRRVAGPRPFALSPAQVARRIAMAVARRQGHLILPWPFALLRLFDRLLPRPLRDRLLQALTPPNG